MYIYIIYDYSKNDLSSRIVVLDLSEVCSMLEFQMKQCFL